ncbi:hypothetical protein Sdia_36740 [Streptomyces diastaticus subsp. diastaticus]|uniref:Uncharacterized protein n=1 Tax=Streptomyces diastaticus subsp. diastaticus TaxID=68040 RepID=A0ABQ1CRA9_STRDI|nr:hypothetical protein Sdia_36740 [Streptomyces diastaticus subsp. diastaticus]GGU43404.1 hypothetical protein GCM10015534_52550 [Streptomyces diastaticus subsp. diastaticus]
MGGAEEVAGALPPNFEVLAAENRRRTSQREGTSVQVDDATLIAKRHPWGADSLNTNPLHAGTMSLFQPAVRIEQLA